MVRDLYTSTALVRILKQVDIGGLIKSVVRRVVCRRSIKVMDVSEASGRVGQVSSLRLGSRRLRTTHSVATFSSPGRAAIFALKLSENQQQEK